MSTGPHQAIETRDARERLTLQLFDSLWDRYRQRVSYVADYERIVAERGATFVNDHIAFRTLATQTPLTGITSISRIFEALGYRAAGVYDFPDKHLSAVHYQHPHTRFPKLFISELRTWELSGDTRRLVTSAIASHRPAVSNEVLARLTEPDPTDVGLLESLVDQFHLLPWRTPNKNDVLKAGEESQYAAWVLVHGYNVNHFTSLVNSHGVDELNDLDKTLAALRSAGVPLKAEIEGERGSKLRQSATAAVEIDVDVTIDGQAATMPWTYAYFELAERNEIADSETGRRVRFEGFLGPQATNLFEMTRVDR